MAAGRHVNTLLESVPALVILIALMAFPGGGTEPLVWGTLAGFVFHLATLAAPLGWRGEIELPYFTRRSSRWAVFWQGFGIMLIGQALMSFIGIIDQFFASSLGTGAIATLSYANRILMLILGLGATAVSRATLPVFSRVQAQGEMQLRHIATHWVRLLFVLGVVAMSFGWWLAPWGVELLFQRGAFTAQDTEVVTEVFRYGLVQVPFYFASLVLVSFLVSQNKYHVVTVIGALNLVIKVVFNILIVPSFGVSGLMISTSCMLIMSCLLLTAAVYKAY